MTKLTKKTLSTAIYLLDEEGETVPIADFLARINEAVEEIGGGGYVKLDYEYDYYGGYTKPDVCYIVDREETDEELAIRQRALDEAEADQKRRNEAYERQVYAALKAKYDAA